MNQSNAAILQGALASFAAGDVPSVLAVCHEDIECRIPGDNLVSGHYIGHDGLLGFFKKLRDLPAEPSASPQPRSLTTAVAPSSRRSRSPPSAAAEHLRFDAIQNWRFADGKAASLHYYHADQSVPDAFWV